MGAEVGARLQLLAAELRDAPDVVVLLRERVAPPRQPLNRVGRDAADVSFITTFGPMQFEYSKVQVDLAG